MLNRHQHSAAPFAANPESLSHSQHHEENRSPYPKGLVCRQQAYQKGRHSHNQKGQHKHGFAPYAVAEVTTDDATQRTRRKAYGIGAEGGEGAGQRVVFREEESGED